MRHVWRDEERLAFTHKIIDDPVTLADADLNIAFQLIEILFRIDAMKVVSGIRSFDHHDKEITTIVKIAVTYWGLEKLAIFFNPFV